MTCSVNHIYFTATKLLRCKLFRFLVSDFLRGSSQALYRAKEKNYIAISLIMNSNFLSDIFIDRTHTKISLR